MKAYLLDTHILLWWLADDKKLSRKLHAIMENPKHVLWVSSVSVWEIIIKKSLGKLTVPDNLLEVLDANNIHILPMTAEHALGVEHLPKIHHDPFDRLLIAQAIVDDLIIITTDSAIVQYPVVCEVG